MIQQGLLASFATAAASSLLTGLVDYYKLNSNSTNSTGNGNGTDTNVSYATAGIIGNSATFNNNGYIATGHKFTAGAKSISLWLKTTSTTDDIFMDNCYRSSTFIGEVLDVNLVANKCRYWVFRGSSGNYKTVTSATSVNSGNWVHIVVTDDGGSTASNLKMYINGSLDATGAQTGTAGTQSGTTYQNTEIGASTGAISYLTGSIDEFGYWNRELTSTEVTSLYNSGNGLTYSF